MDKTEMPGTGHLAIYRKLLREVRQPGCPWPAPPAEPPASASDDEPCPVFVVGAHGGAGTSTVARLLNGLDSGCIWPGPPDGIRVNVVLTARTNAAGLMAASRTLAGYCAHGYPQSAHLAGFVLVADAPGRLPKELNRRITVLASATRVYRLPWVHEWRLSEVAPDPLAAWPLAASMRTWVRWASAGAVPALKGVA
ncbi:MAG TPA: DUF6668 family protein [Streptosporangiaceae bacterium]|jgi:hypothetical protein|nr:DUF6668 family protein [Streptosporangiaceae bacterium]